MIPEATVRNPELTPRDRVQRPEAYRGDVCGQFVGRSC
jgi:hypothetical protein